MLQLNKIIHTPSTPQISVRIENEWVKRAPGTTKSIQKLFERFLPEHQSLIPKMTSQLNSYTTYIKENNSIPYGMILTNAGMESHAARYSQKYNIQMTTFEFNEDLSNNDHEIGFREHCDFCSAKISENESPFIGVIFLLPGIGHVVPVIFHTKESKPIAAVILDVLDTSSTVLVERVQLFLKILEIPFAASEDRVQHDTFSCRTGALVTLRNALIHLKGKNCTAKKLFDIKESGTFFPLPPQWGFTNQIFKNDAQINLLTVRKYETIQEHRNRFTQSVKISYEIRLPYLADEAAPQKFSSEHYSMERSIYNESYFITWTDELQINTYMLRKGFKLAGMPLPPGLKEKPERQFFGYF